jgi:hypothetical protein
MSTTPKAETLSLASWLRLAAAGALAGAGAGALFGMCAFAIQNAVTRNAVATYGDAAVDHGAPFLQAGSILSMCVLGGFVGLVYATVRVKRQWLSRWGGIVFAAVLAILMQPLLSAGLLYLSAVVTLTVSHTMPGGFVKSGPESMDLAPAWLWIAVMTAMVFVAGLLIHRLLALTTRWMPQLPGAAYAVIAGLIALPGLALFVLLVLSASGALGGE